MKILKATGIQTRHIVTPWMSVADAAAYCGLSISTFRDLIGRHPLACSRISSRIPRYHAADIDAWIKTISHTATQEDQQP